MKKPLALLAALLTLSSAPALAGGPGVSVILDNNHNGRARIKVQNPGNTRGHYQVGAFDIDGNELPVNATPKAFYLGRGRTRKVRLSGLPTTTTHLCASVSASQSLVLRSCASTVR